MPIFAKIAFAVNLLDYHKTTCTVIAMDLLAQKHCAPCDGTVPALTDEKIKELLPQVPKWQLMEPKNPGEDSLTGSGQDKKLRREFKFPGFKEAIAFVNQVAEIAEAEDHHPNIHILYNRVRLDLTTHVAHGLTENDFIVAAKIDELAKNKLG